MSVGFLLTVQNIVHQPKQGVQGVRLGQKAVRQQGLSPT